MNDNNLAQPQKDRVLISIISDHILPNYLFAMEKIDYFDVFVFVTTKEMESRHVADHFENALHLEHGTVERIIVENDNYASIKENLSNCHFDKDDEYWINQTGGTKAMSIALYEYFISYDSHFVYIPIGTNTYYDFDSKDSFEIKYRLNLKEYLTLYGLRSEYDNKLLFDASKAYEVFDNQKNRGFNLSSDIVDAQLKSTKKEKRYYSGEWFEEYAFLRIKNDLSIDEQNIGRGVKIFRDENPVINDNNDNEIDVMFVKDNVLNIVECKVGIRGLSGPRKTIELYQYKLAAIAKDLGLRVNSYLFTLHKMSGFSEKEREAIMKRNQILGIKGILGAEILAQDGLNL